MTTPSAWLNLADFDFSLLRIDWHTDKNELGLPDGDGQTPFKAG